MSLRLFLTIFPAVTVGIMVALIGIAAFYAWGRGPGAVCAAGAWQERVLKKLGTRVRWQQAVFVALAVAVVVLLYGRYLFGWRMYLFHESAYDLFCQTYPTIIDRARSAGETGFWARYSLRVGLGNPDSPMNLFSFLVALCGESNIPYMLGLFQSVKVWLTAIFFFAFLRKSGCARAACVIGALGFALCGPMMIRSAWNAYPNEILLMAMILLALEKLLKGESKLWFAAAFALFVMSMDPVRCIVYALLFPAYILIRLLLDEENTKAKRMLARLGAVLGMELMGFALAAFVFLPILYQFVFSARAEASVSAGGKGMEWLTNGQTLYTAILRLFGNDILGNSHTYQGALNYNEGPTFYFGIVSLLMVPQVFVKAKGKRRLVYALCLLAAVAYVVVQPLRMLANGLSKETFKLSSLWIVMILLYLATVAWTRLFRQRVLSVRLLIGTAIAALVALGFSAWRMGPAVDKRYVLLAAGIIALGVAALWLYQKRPVVSMKAALCLLAALELFLTGFGPSNTREDFTPEELALSTVIYNDVGAMSRAFQETESDFFRISHLNANYCEGLSNSYLSTRGYQGGAALAKGFTQFVGQVQGETPKKIGFDPFTFNGFDSMRAVNTLVGVRYMAAEGENSIGFLPYGYTAVEWPGWTVYENRYAIPLAFTYDRVMSQTDFLALERVERREALLEAAVVEDDSPALMAGLPVETGLSWNMAETLRKNTLPLETEAVAIPGGVTRYVCRFPAQAEQPYVYLLANLNMRELTEHSLSPVEVEWGRMENGERVAIGGLSFLTPAGDDQLAIEIPAQGIDYISIIAYSYCKSITFDAVAPVGEDFFQPYQKAAMARSQDVFEFTRLQDNHIEGSITLGEPRLLCFSFCQVQGWEAWVDGEPAEIIPTDTAFLGLMLDAGAHEVKLSYTAPWQREGMALTLGGAILFLGLLILEIIRREKKKRLKQGGI